MQIEMFEKQQEKQNFVLHKLHASLNLKLVFTYSLINPKH